MLIGPLLQKKKSVILPANKRTREDIEDLNEEDEDEDG